MTRKNVKIVQTSATRKRPVSKSLLHVLSLFYMKKSAQTSSEIVRLSGLSGGYVHPAVGRLRGRGWLVAEPRKADEQFSSFRLSEEGREITDELIRKNLGRFPFLPEA